MLTVTARYPGSVGNKLTVKLLESEEGEGPLTVQTFLDGRLMEEQQAETADALQDNQWVTFSGTGALLPHAGIVLAGGTDDEAEEEDWEDFSPGQSGSPTTRWRCRRQTRRSSRCRPVCQRDAGGRRGQNPGGPAQH